MWSSSSNLIVNISANYPGVYAFLLVLSAFLGFCMTGYVLMLVVRVRVFGTLQPSEFPMGAAVLAILTGSALAVFPWVMLTLGNSFLGAGYGSLFPPEAVIDNGQGAHKLVGAFAEQSARMIGVIFGLWGLCEVFTSQLPKNQGESPWPGIVRVCLGTVLILARDVANLVFSGMGDRVFG